MHPNSVLAHTYTTAADGRHYGQATVVIDQLYHS